MKVFIAVSSRGCLDPLVSVAEKLGFKVAGVQMRAPCDFLPDTHADLFGEAVSLAQGFGPDFLALDHQVFGASFTGRNFAESLSLPGPCRRIGLDDLVDQSGYCEAITSSSSENIASLWSRFERLPRSSEVLLGHEFPYLDDLPARFCWVLQLLKLQPAP